MNSTGQQSASSSVQQPATTSALAMAQQVHQMPSARRSMTPMSPQPVMATNPANMVSPQQIPVADRQVDWNSKIAEVMREQFD